MGTKPQLKGIIPALTTRKGIEALVATLAPSKVSV